MYASLCHLVLVLDFIKMYKFLETAVMLGKIQQCAEGFADCKTEALINIELVYNTDLLSIKEDRCFTVHQYALRSSTVEMCNFDTNMLPELSLEKITFSMVINVA